MYRETKGQAVACYGIALRDMQRARKAIEAALGIELRPRNSMAKGDYFGNWPSKDPRVDLVENNFDQEDWIEADSYDDFPLRVEISTDGDLRALEEKLEAVAELKLTFLPDINPTPNFQVDPDATLEEYLEAVASHRARRREREGYLN